MIKTILAQFFCPGVITDNPAKPGGYFGCNLNIARYFARGNFYLINHPNLTWIPSNDTHALTLKNAITIGSILFGRIIKNGVTYLGKYQVQGFHYVNTSIEVRTSSGFDILTCGLYFSTILLRLLRYFFTDGNQPTTPAIVQPCGKFLNILKIYIL